jgi:heme A synthase
MVSAVDISAGQPPLPAQSRHTRKYLWIAAAVVGVVLVLIALGSYGSSDNSDLLVDTIRSDGQSQIQAGVAQSDPSASVSVDDVECVQSGKSQTYSCFMHYTVVATSFHQSPGSR